MMALRGAWICGLLLLSGCRTAGGPERAVEDYARAIEEGRLDDAYALSAAGAGARPGREAFIARYGDPARRQARAGELRGSMGALRAVAPGVVVVREGEQWRVLEQPPDAGPGQALSRFLDAAERGDFPAAYALLSASWRSRYTPERLARDFALEPLARERLARARAALALPPLLKDGAAEFPIGEGRAVRLVREGDDFRVAALE